MQWHDSLEIGVASVAAIHSTAKACGSLPSILRTPVPNKSFQPLFELPEVPAIRENGTIPLRAIGKSLDVRHDNTVTDHEDVGERSVKLFPQTMQRTLCLFER